MNNKVDSSDSGDELEAKTGAELDKAKRDLESVLKKHVIEVQKLLEQGNYEGNQNDIDKIFGEMMEKINKDDDDDDHNILT